MRSTVDFMPRQGDKQPVFLLMLRMRLVRALAQCYAYGLQTRSSFTLSIIHYQLSILSVWGEYIDELIQMKTAVTSGGSNLPAGDYYPLQDLLYRNTALTDNAGAIVETYDCDAYGNTLIFKAAGTNNNWWADDAVQTDNPACEIIYCGYRYDPESGMYQVRHRIFNPALGRWMQRDLIMYLSGLNLYQYVRSNPFLFLDPFGLNPMPGYWNTAWYNPLGWYYNAFWHIDNLGYQMYLGLNQMFKHQKAQKKQFKQLMENGRKWRKCDLSIDPGGHMRKGLEAMRRAASEGANLTGTIYGGLGFPGNPFPLGRNLLKHGLEHYNKIPAPDTNSGSGGMGNNNNQSGNNWVWYKPWTWL